MKLLLILLLVWTVSAFAPPSVVVRSSTTSIAAAAKAEGTLGLVEGEFQTIFVAGGSKGVGRCVIDTILAEGENTKIVALVRSDDAVTELNGISDNVKAVQGDAFDYKTVEDAMYGCDAVITTLGGSTNDDDKRVDYTGNANLIEAAGILGITRVVLVTSIGCGSSKEAAPPAVFEVLKDVLAAKEKAENMLIRYYTNTNWTIIRPGGLKSESATGKAVLTANNKALGSIHREDVAALVVKALRSANTKKMILSAIDPSITAAASAEAADVEPFEL